LNAVQLATGTFGSFSGLAGWLFAMVSEPQRGRSRRRRSLLAMMMLSSLPSSFGPMAAAVGSASRPNRTGERRSQSMSSETDFGPAVFVFAEHVEVQTVVEEVLDRAGR
jgi:hypothetical protein